MSCVLSRRSPVRSSISDRPAGHKHCRPTHLPTHAETTTIAVADVGLEPAAPATISLGYTLASDPRLDSRASAPFVALGMGGAPEPCPVTRASPREEIQKWSAEMEAGFGGSAVSAV
jgi:hypothetical protein